MSQIINVRIRALKRPWLFETTKAISIHLVELSAYC